MVKNSCTCFGRTTKKNKPMTPAKTLSSSHNWCKSSTEGIGGPCEGHIGTGGGESKTPGIEKCSICKGLFKKGRGVMGGRKKRRKRRKKTRKRTKRKIHKKRKRTKRRYFSRKSYKCKK